MSLVSSTVDRIVAVRDDRGQQRQRANTVNLVLGGLVVVLFGVLAWRVRWMADDGLIVLRTVRQILAGNGPVFNIGERVETNTSVLWTYLLAGLGLTGIPLEWLAVCTGFSCSVAGLALGLDGARRLHSGGRSLLVPAGALVVCALQPFQEFATSGLETGLMFLWLGGTWWLLVYRGRMPGARMGPVAVMIGLGPLIRPELALFSMAAFVTLILVRRPPWRRSLGLLGAAGALPVAYQIFRMGYYGLLTPSTALAKEATESRWTRGLLYLANMNGPYLLWLPLLTLAGVLVISRRYRTDTVLVVAPIVTGITLALYVVAIGGDFMHARMLLPAVFCVLLPVLVFPVTKWTTVPMLVVAVWAATAAGWLRAPDGAEIPDSGIAHERAYWSANTGQEHPIVAEEFRVIPMMGDGVRIVEQHDGPILVTKGGDDWSTYPTTADHSTIITCCIGAVAVLTPLDVRVHDYIGLANPVAAHATGLPNGRAGHDKFIPVDWEVAESGVDDPRFADARAALACPETREMLDSVRQPMTFGRFWDNLVGAVGRSSFRYSYDPAVAKNCASPR